MYHFVFPFLVLFWGRYPACGRYHMVSLLLGISGVDKYNVKPG